MYCEITLGSREWIQAAADYLGVAHAGLATVGAALLLFCTDAPSATAGLTHSSPPSQAMLARFEEWELMLRETATMEKKSPIPHVKKVTVWVATRAGKLDEADLWLAEKFNPNAVVSVRVNMKRNQTGPLPQGFARMWGDLLSGRLTG